MTESYIMDKNKFVIEILKPYINNNRLFYERCFLGVDRYTNGIMSPCTYFVNHYPHLVCAMPGEEILVFSSIKDAKRFVENNLIKIVREIGEIKEINFCSRELTASTTYEAKFEIDQKYLSPKAYQIDNTSHYKE